MIDTSKGHVSIAKVDLLIQLTFRAAAPWPWAKPVVQGEPLARTGVNGHAAVEVATLRLGVPAALGVRSAGTLLTHKAKKHVAPRALSPVVELEVSVFVSGGLGGFLALAALALALGALALAAWPRRFLQKVKICKKFSDFSFYFVGKLSSRDKNFAKS